MINSFFPFYIIYFLPVTFKYTYVFSICPLMNQKITNRVNRPVAAKREGVGEGIEWVLGTAGANYHIQSG